MARNRSIDHLRARRVTPASPGDAAARSLLSDSDLFEELVAKDLQQDVHDTPQALAPQCREAFRLSRDKGLGRREIAARMGISENTVKYHIKQALAEHPTPAIEFPHPNFQLT